MPVINAFFGSSNLVTTLTAFVSIFQVQDKMLKQSPRQYKIKWVNKSGGKQMVIGSDNRIRPTDIVLGASHLMYTYICQWYRQYSEKTNCTKNKNTVQIIWWIKREQDASNSIFLTQNHTNYGNTYDRVYSNKMHSISSRFQRIPELIVRKT